MRTSVIIRCKNEEQWIGHAIQSVVDNLKEPQIIVVNNHSTDDSLDIIRMFETFHNISVLSIDKYSPGRALNEAVKTCCHPVTLVLSAHCVINKFDEEEVHQRLNFDCVCLFGKQIPVYKGRKINKRYIWSHFGDEPATNMWSDIEQRYFLHNAFAVYRTEILKELPFDEHLYGKEDRYWAKEAIDKCSFIRYEPEICCFHHWTINGATWKGIG